MNIIDEKQLNQEELSLPTVEVIEKTLQEAYHHEKKSGHFPVGTGIFIVFLIVALFVFHVFFSIVRIFGSSMEPNIPGSSIVLCKNTDQVDRGDIIAFYHDGKLLVREIAGLPGDQMDQSADGLMIVNGEESKEAMEGILPSSKDNISYPYTVPEGQYFVVAKNTFVGVDSREELFGCVRDEDLLGRVVYIIWPFGKLR